jgi:mRNA interferase MazF
VLTRRAAIAVLNSVIVAPATRSIRRIPTEVFLDATDGMPRECVLSLDNLTIVPKRLLTSRITTLDAVRMDQVCQALRIAVECGW